MAQYNEAELQNVHSVAQYNETELQKLHSVAQYNEAELQKVHSVAQYNETELQKLHSVAQYNAADLQRVKSVAQNNEAELQRVHSVAQYTDPYQDIIYCRNIIRFYDTSTNANSSTAFPVPTFTLLTTSVNVCGHFLNLTYYKVEEKCRNKTGNARITQQWGAFA